MPHRATKNSLFEMFHSPPPPPHLFLTCQGRSPAEVLDKCIPVPNPYAFPTSSSKRSPSTCTSVDSSRLYYLVPPNLDPSYQD
ncbi:hypothetical protein TNCV_2242401 [Trichonephila clavipes]|nr:hypothetical protein TNCV_2242401 [Trichonephila clavipes]